MVPSGPLSCPTTPSKQMDALHKPTAKYDSASSPPDACPSEMSSPGDTVNDSPFPVTPSSMKDASSARNITRRRGKTISTLPDVTLMNHAIFSLTHGIRSFNLGDEYSIDENEAQRITTGSKITKQFDNPEETNLQEIEEESSDYSAAGYQQFSVKSETSKFDTTSQYSGHNCDLKDLARHGMPSACVFVANLAASQTDEQLMKNLQAHFGRFGRLHVKIRRDVKGNPYSFCQFESDEAARIAVREGRNAVIDTTGRRIRCEPAKVNRTLVLSKLDNSPFDDTEARKILFGFGETESLEFARDMYAMPVRGSKEGRRCFVRFSFRQDAVDCYQYFRFHGTWTAEWTSNFSAPNILTQIHAVEIDPFSIFIGKLNADRSTEAELRSRFSKYGTIVECNLLNRMSKNGLGRNAFAFIKYESEEMATAAMEHENNSQFLGSTIHVQKREMHKKPVRPSITSIPRFGNAQFDEKMDRNIAEPSFYFSLREVADLAARLSVQLVNKHDQNRRQSMASVVSDTSAYNAINYPLGPEASSGRRDSFQSTTSNGPSFMFRQPFQTSYGMNSRMPMTMLRPDTPVSPRTGQATTVAQTDKLTSETPGHYLFSPEYQISPTSLSQGGNTQSHGDPYCGPFPPLQHQFSPPHMITRVAGSGDQAQHRDSITSVSYDPVGLYNAQFGGFTTQQGLHMSPIYPTP